MREEGGCSMQQEEETQMLFTNLVQMLSAFW
jgi:hypothetical protein